MDTFPTEWISNYSLNGTETSLLGGIENGKEFYLGETIATGLVLSTIILITIFGNTLVLLAVFLNSHLRSTTNYFIVNLAFADLFLGTTVLPFSATLETLHYWPFGYTICDLWAAADVLWCTASILTLCVISIDRYIGVTRPLQHSSIINEKRALCIIILVWILSMVISIAPLIGWRESKGPDPRKCTVTQQIGYVIFSVSGSFYIPMFIIIIVYIRIYKEASRHSRYLNRAGDTDIDKLVNGVALRIHTGRTSKTSYVPQYNNDNSKDKSAGSRSRTRQSVAEKIAKFKKEKKAAKTLGIVVGVFILCWFPFFFCLPLDVLCTSCNIPKLFFTIVFWLGYCNSMMNPIIYACSSKEFQRAFIRILKCQFRRHPRLLMNRGPSNVSAQIVSFCKHKAEKCSIANSTRLGDVYSMKQLPDSLRVSLAVYHAHAKNDSCLSKDNVDNEVSENVSSSDNGDDNTSQYSLRRSFHNSVHKASCSNHPNIDENHHSVISFEKDENYIKAFRKRDSHGELV